MHEGHPMRNYTLESQTFGLKWLYTDQPNLLLHLHVKTDVTGDNCDDGGASAITLPLGPVEKPP
jgi:hypothetical protein